MEAIISQVHQGVGLILLNRPAAINALTGQMIHDLTTLLSDWAVDPGVERVVVSGVGRGFCAGADVRQLRLDLLQGHDGVEFLEQEYRLDQLIATYPKPYASCLHGVVMGGGMGISIHGSQRLVRAGTTLAMPETIIGLWPDVGMTYWLSRLPGEIGTFMALTGLGVSAAQAVSVGLADRWWTPDADVSALSPTQMLDLLVAEVESGRGHHPRGDQPPEGTIPADQWMESAFSGDDPIAIMSRLADSAIPAASAAASAIMARSPVSVVVTLAALRRARTMTLPQVFDQDLRLGRFFLARPDFVEGVRAQLVDRDHRPHWSISALSAVPRGIVDEAFSS
ncbi:MAG: enoyl-CoA hydratase/isomerase family protein [Propionibacteriaceae bacterium]|jgi:enoyl-CoA hydratase|nr:enoyl-CoA hydratase/isomerase family protein [Propionibacteriaceae bacterium]